MIHDDDCLVPWRLLFRFLQCAFFDVGAFVSVLVMNINFETSILGHVHLSMLQRRQGRLS